MKKFLIALFIFLLSSPVYAENFRAIYKGLEVPQFAYLHGVDPKHFFENRYSSYSVYPLLRLSSPLYFKTVTILPGYYDLTPRIQDGQEYILFKQNGLVVHVIPVYKKEVVPPGFYKTHLPKPKYKLTQKIGNAFYSFVGKCFKSAKRRPLAKTYLEVNDTIDNFVQMVIYYDDFRYYILTRSVKL